MKTKLYVVRHSQTTGNVEKRLTGRSDYEITEYIDLLSDYLYHMHFSDNSGKTDEHKRVNSGTIDFVSVFKALNKISYHELHCMEVLFKKYTDLIEYAKDIDIYDKYYK